MSEMQKNTTRGVAWLRALVAASTLAAVTWGPRAAATTTEPRVRRGLPYASRPVVLCRESMRGMSYVDTDLRPPVLCVCAGDLPSYCRADTGTCYTADDCVPGAEPMP